MPIEVPFGNPMHARTIDQPKVALEEIGILLTQTLDLYLEVVDMALQDVDLAGGWSRSLLLQDFWCDRTRHPGFLQLRDPPERFHRPVDAHFSQDELAHLLP